MMRASAVLIAVSLVCTAAVAVSAVRLREARRTSDAAAAYHVRLSADAARLLRLRGATEQISLSPRPPQDVLALVSQTLAEIGLPSARLSNLAPESDAAVARSPDQSGPGLRRQTLRFTLEGLTVRELGEFLALWHDRQTLWSISRLDLTIGAGTARDQGRYSVAVQISATYVDDAPATPASPARLSARTP